MTIAYVIKEHFQQTIKEGTGVVHASALKKLTELSEKSPGTARMGPSRVFSLEAGSLLRARR